MKISIPSYFHQFRCIADRCPDSCCKEWDVQVDAASAAYYRSLPGDLGDRLRQVLEPQQNGSATMSIEDGRCPMWRQDGLCRIQAALGEGALCRTCREFPRLTHDYGDFVEKGLELSCPEAAKYILTDREFAVIESNSPGGEEPEYDQEAMEVLLRTRENALGLLRDPRYSVPQALGLLLLYGYQAQGELDGEDEMPFDPQTALATADQFADQGDPENMLDFLKELEILTPAWAELLAHPTPGEWAEAHRAIAGYMVRRYWLQAVSDYDLACRVKFMVIACVAVKQLGGDTSRTAQLFSKEIENSADNVDAILDASYSHQAFTDARLLGSLL